MSDQNEDVYFHRLICLIAEVGREILLKLFLHKIPNNDLKSFLSARRENITNLLEQDLITVSDYDVLAGEAPDISRLAISVLLTLLCHVCEGITAPTTGWEKIPPSADDKSIGAWLLRLKECRNEILAYRDSMKIDKWQFKGLWKEIKKVLKNISKTMGDSALAEFEARANEVESSAIDPNIDWHVLNLHTLLKWYEQDVNQACNSLHQVVSSVSSEMEQLQKKACEGTDMTDAVRLDRGDQKTPNSSLHKELANLEQAFAHIKLENRSIPSLPTPDLGSLQEIQDNLNQYRQQIDNLQSKLRVLYGNLQVKAPSILADGSGQSQGTSLQTVKSQVQAQAESPKHGQVPQQQASQTVHTGEIGFHPIQRPSQTLGLLETGFHHVQRPQQTLGVEEAGTQPIPDKDLRKYSNFIGMNWEMTGYSLGYADYQMHSLKRMYPQQAETRIFIMLKKWHDVVLRQGEKVRDLLAKAFVEEGNNEAAENIVGAHRLAAIQQAKLVYKSTTEHAIKQISFEVPLSGQPGRVNIGASGAVNVFPGSELVMAGSLSIGSSSVKTIQPDISPYLGHLQPGTDVNVGGHGSLNVYNTRFETKPSSNIAIGGTDNVRGEIFDSTDSPLSAIPPFSHSNQLKKEFNDNLTESQVQTLGELMKSVCAVFSPWIHGTAFRVGSRYLVTALHVISGILEKDGMNLSSEYVKVYFGEKINMNPDQNMNPDLFYQLKDVFLSDEILDIAFLEIANPDEKLPKPLHMAALNIEESIKALSLIGYGNPYCSMTKHLDPSCPVIPQTSTVIVLAHAYLRKHNNSLRSALLQSNKDPGLVDLGYSGYDAKHNVIINCFSEKGASGGPLIDCRNPSYPQVVGVLTHGLPVCFWDLNLPSQEYFPKCFRLEVGTRLTAMKAWMQRLVEEGKCSTDVFNDLFS